MMIQATRGRDTFSLRRRLQRILGRDWQVAWPFIAPVVALMVGFIAWPLVEAVVISFTARTIRGEQYWVWFDNYIRLWQDPFFWMAVRTTIIYTTACILLKFIFGLTAALVIQAQVRGRDVLTGMILLPWIIPSVVQALTWKSIFDPLFGSLNYILLQLGIISEGISWLGNPRLALPAVIAANVWAGIPFFTVNILAGLQSIPQELYEAAEVDGASEWQRFRHISLPGIRYVALVAVLLSTIWTFNSFEVIFLLTGGGPAGMTRVYSVLTYQYGMIGLRFGPAAAIALSMTPVLAFLILLLSGYMRRDVSADLEETWQSRLLSALGRVFGLILRIVLFPVQLVLNGLEAAGKAARRAIARPAAAARRQARRRMWLIVRLLTMAVLLLLIYFPFYWVVVTAFKTELQITLRQNILWPAPWSMEQFNRLFNEQPFFTWARNTTIVTTFSTILSVAFSALGAYALARLRFRGADTLNAVLLVTYLIPGALMFIPLYQILTQLGLINSLAGLIAVYPTFMMPFSTWLLLGYYRSIPEDLEHAAMVDGATRLGAFLRVTLPLTKPALLAVALFAFTSAWKEFLYAFVFIRSDNLKTLTVGMATTIYGDIYPWGLLMASALVISIPVVILYMSAQRFMVAGLTAGAIKGGG
jgi:multiple sugar transport system permease protein